MIAIKVTEDAETIDARLGIKEERCAEICDLVRRSIKDTATEETIGHRGNAIACMKVLSENVDTIEELVFASFVLGKSLGILETETRRVIRLAQLLAELEEQA